MQEPKPQTSGTVTTEFARILSEISTKGDLPAGAEVIHQMENAVRKENCNALDVVRIILKDAALSSKVLRVVNSSFYRRSGNPVSTVTGATILLGFQTIRDLSTGLLLIDHFARTGGTSHVYDGLSRSLYCALLSQTLSEQVGYSNPEEAYLLGLVANFAHLWLAAYYPGDFEKAVRLQKREHLSLDQALARTVGGAPGDIAAAALEHWNFPPLYLQYFRNPPATDRQSIVTPSARLSAIVNISADYIARATEEGTKGERRVLHRFQDLFCLKSEVFFEAARAASAEFRKHAPLNGLPEAPLLNAGLLRDVQDSENDTDKIIMAEHTDGGARERGAPRSRRGGSHQPLTPAEAEATGTGFEPPTQHEAATVIGIIADITRSILDRSDINETLSMVLEGVERIGRFEAVLLALLNVKADRIVARLGYGEGIQEDLGKLSVPVREGAGLLAETVLRRSPQIVADASAAILVPRGAPVPEIPGRYFVSHPVIVRGKILGALVASRTESPPAQAEDLAVLRLFCDHACLAFDKSVD